MVYCFVVINIVFREGAGVAMWTELGDSSDITGALQYTLHICTQLEIMYNGGGGNRAEKHKK